MIKNKQKNKVAFYRADQNRLDKNGMENSVPQDGPQLNQEV